MPKDEIGPKMPEPNSDAMPFLLNELRKGKLDPRDRIVRDILWSLDDFKIYKTDQGISPFFSDTPELAKIQRQRYLDLEGIADFNHLIHILKPAHFPFTERPVVADSAGQRHLVHYERELARCVAQALLGQGEAAALSLSQLRARLAARISNHARVIHLMINAFLVALTVAGALIFAKSNYNSVFGFDVKELGLALMMGSVGALFSTTVRLQKMEVDPTVPQYMHWVYATQRVVVGALGAMILYFGFKSGVVTGLFQPATGDGVPPATYDPFWLSFVCVLAGFSERLVPNLLNGKAKEVTEVEAE